LGTPLGQRLGVLLLLPSLRRRWSLRRAHPTLSLILWRWFSVNGIGRMIGCGDRQRRELLIDRGATRSKGGPNCHRNPPVPIWTGRPAQTLFGSVRARFSPRGSSWNFGLSPLYLRHFEVVIPEIKIGGLLVWSPNFTS
jgi:hypothetical protein